MDFKIIKGTSEFITELGLQNSSAKWIKPHSVIVAMYGATAGKCAINDISLTTNQACCNIEVDDSVALYKYVYYWLVNHYQDLKAMGQGSQNNINAQIIKNYFMSLPSLERQKQIVEILDRFDAICNDLTAGLPAEIEARKKQYEYYRERLLNFPEKILSK